MKKVYLETFGCQMNVSDSERVATLLEKQGYQITPTEEAADVVIFNTCSVREKAEHKLYTRVGQVRKAARAEQLVGILGCVAQLEGETLFQKIEGVDFILGTKAVGRVHLAIEKVSAEQRRFLDLGDRETDYNWTVAETQRRSPYVAFVPIIEGCNKFCTYCIVPFARGRERSLPAAEIIRHVLELRRQGIREVHLIGQNVNSYRPLDSRGLEKFQGATAFSKLLRAVAATGIERVKFTTSFPRDFHPDIVAAINENENLCNWVHLPVQSGSDKILQSMRRGHTAENYLRRVERIKNSPRNISLTTDIIVGFPGETEADFRATAELVDRCQYDAAYIFKYSPRAETPAALLPDNVSAAEKTRRFLELEKIQKANQMKIGAGLIGKTLSVLAESRSSKNPRELTGHSTCHRVLNFPGGENLLGKLVSVKITENKVNSLYGTILE